MDAFELADLAAQQAAGGRPYLEFLTVPDLSVGLYVLRVGQPDLQQPHTEDEVYYVVSGRARSCSWRPPSRTGSTTSPRT